MLRFIDGAAWNSGQRLANVNRTLLVLACGKLILQKTLNLCLILIRDNKNSPVFEKVPKTSQVFFRGYVDVEAAASRLFANRLFAIRHFAEHRVI